MSKLHTWMKKLLDRLNESYAGRPGQHESSRRAEAAGLLKEPELSPLRLFRPRPKPRNFALGVVMTVLKILLLTCLVAAFVGAGFVLGIAEAYVATTPDLDISRIEDQSRTSFIYDANGGLITTYAGVENRIWAAADEIPQQLFDAITSIEDARFYTHPGVDLKRIVGALFSNLRSSGMQGGSTITQQLIKMRILSSEQTYKRKLQEAYLAIQLEKQFTKEEILVAYLNTINLAQSNYGVKAAAEDYFGKELKDLTLRECAMLAGCAQAPYTYDPRANWYTREKPYLTNDRTDLVLSAMYRNDKITREEYEAALAEEVTILEVSPRKNSGLEYQWFVEYAMNDVIEHMLRARGLEDTDANRSKIEQELRTGGYSIYLTLDPSIQQAMQDTIYNWDAYPEMVDPAASVTTTVNADGSVTRLQQPQVAANVIDYRTGYVKALVGGRQEPTVKKGLNRVNSAQPMGSSVKPISVYGPALDRGLGAASPLYDMPLPITGWGGRGYPQNSGGRFVGSVSLRYAVEHSRNVTAAHVLADVVGYDTSVQYLRALGVESTLNVDGPGLALGTSGINVMEMAGAYSALANGGCYREPITFTKVTDSRGNVVLDAAATQTVRQVYKPATAWLMTDILVSTVADGTAGKGKVEGMTTAAKTGTNSDNCGVSYVGYTPYYVSAIWVGHDNYKAMASTSGSSGAAPIFADYMSKIHEGLEDKPIYSTQAEEAGLVRATVCKASGLLATDACKADASCKPITDWMPADSVPTEKCTWHKAVDICETTGKLAGVHCPETEREKGSLLVIPEGTQMDALEWDTVLKYFPKAMTAAEAGTLDENDPALEGLFCTRHSAAWEKENARLMQSAQTLINTVQDEMAARTLSAGAVKKLNAALDTLVSACNESGDNEEIKAALDALTLARETWLVPEPTQPEDPADPADGPELPALPEE